MPVSIECLVNVCMHLQQWLQNCTSPLSIFGMGDKYLQLFGLEKDGGVGLSRWTSFSSLCSWCSMFWLHWLIVSFNCCFWGGGYPSRQLFTYMEMLPLPMKASVMHTFPLSNEGSLVCHSVYSETRVISEDRWHSRLLLCIWQCHVLSLHVVNDSGLSRPRIEHLTFPYYSYQCDTASDASLHVVWDLNWLL